MRHHLGLFGIKISEEDRPYWVPILFGIGLAFVALGISILGPPKWVGWFDVAAGMGFVYWAVAWGKKRARRDNQCPQVAK